MGKYKSIGNSGRTSGFAVLRVIIPSILNLFPTSGLRKGIYGHAQLFADAPGHRPNLLDFPVQTAGLAQF